MPPATRLATCARCIAQHLYRLPRPSSSQFLTPPLPLPHLTDSHPPRRHAVGPYRLLAEAGRGGAGIVYRARHLAARRIVALKLLRSSALADPIAVARFHSEVRAVSRLRHPAIVPILEFSQSFDEPYFVMQWIDGPPLSALIRRQPLPPSLAARIIHDVALALAHAHQHGVVHRDVKPSNILLDSIGAAWLTDFGLAKQLDSDQHLTRAGEIVGSPAYMSPEQTHPNGGAPTPASDIYSLGATLYHLVCGLPPHHDASIHLSLQRRLSEDPVPPRQLNPALSRELDSIIQTAIARSPSDRFASAFALAEALSRTLARRATSLSFSNPFSVLVRSPNLFSNSVFSRGRLFCLLALIVAAGFAFHLFL